MKTNTLLLTLALTTGLWTACSSSEPKVASNETAVKVEVAYPTHYDSTAITVSGQLSAQNSAEISTRMMAFVEKVFVKPGDKVQTGQTLIRLNADELEAKKAQASAQIATAELAAKNAAKDYQRFQALHAQESASDKELENMELHQRAAASQLQMARQGLKEIEAMLTYTVIKAPFSGTVTQKNIDEGSMAKPGMPLLSIEQHQDMEVTATVPENEVSRVTLGDRVEVEVKALGRTLPGVISELSPSATRNGGQYAMKISLTDQQDSQLRSGMYVTVRLPRKSQDTVSNLLLIDQSALIQREQLQGVYIVNDNQQAVLRWLRLGKTYGQQIQVLSGLKENERIIINAQGKLYNGRKVTLK